MYSFEKLDVFNKSRELVKSVYILQQRFPIEERYSLGDQIRRAAVSITSNIAEGSGRDSIKENIHFITIAYGSLTETFSQLLIAKDLGYITQQDIDLIRPQFEEVSRMLSGLKKSLSLKLSLNSKP